MQGLQRETSHEQLEQALAELRAQRHAYSAISLADRIGLIESCMKGIQQVAEDWVTAACDAKGIPAEGPVQSEEWLAGPVATLRYLTLLRLVLRDIQQHGQLALPAAPYLADDERVHVPILPTVGLYDRIVFAGFRATVRMLDESFVCVFAEVALDAPSPESFLNQAVDFANERLFGTLSAALTFPSTFRQVSNQRLVQDCLARLRYGTVGINHWPGIAYAIMSPPWGGYPGSTLEDAQSGIGWVHNTYMLERIEKTILEGPLAFTPRPIWFAGHRRANSVTRSLFRLYPDPSPTRLLPLLLNSLRS